MNIDKKFTEVFQGKLCQVFIYLIDQCNLNCVHCLYKPQLTFQLSKKMIPFNTAKSLLDAFKKLGATKVTLMGGEPTLYPQLLELIIYAKNIGYTYVRIDTNGMFDSKLLENPDMKNLDEITFSLDGYNSRTNDFYRGKGVFKKCSSNIKRAVKLGYKVQITSCVHKRLTKIDDGKLGIIRMIEYAKKLDIDLINFHDLLKMKIPRDVWTGNISPSFEEYSSAIARVLEYMEQNKSFKIRIPQRLIKASLFMKNPEYYGYCSGKQSDRLLVFPDGILRICSLLIGSPYYIGTYDHDSIKWNNSPTNEMVKYNNKYYSPCSVSKNTCSDKSIVPLCIAFKPKQSEPIWNYRLKWEERKK
jgi:MoaA/NifB/PqqE/SkfB family radical SAM enzyme